MAWKEILLHVGDDPRADIRFDIAARLAKAHDARLVGLHALETWKLPGYLRIQVDSAEIAEAERARRAAADETGQNFEAALRKAGLAGEWRLAEGRPLDVLARQSRYADLIVVGQQDPDRPEADAGLSDELVLTAGRPVLAVPYAGNFDTVGQRVVIAWNATREAARAVHDALPLLVRADRVIVYVINPADDRHIAGADIAAYLAGHGVKVDAQHVTMTAEVKAAGSAVTSAAMSDVSLGRPAVRRDARHAALAKPDVGNALLAAVSDFGADLLVMGAYGHSRLRELTLGGATRHLMREMTVPVLLAR